MHIEACAVIILIRCEDILLSIANHWTQTLHVSQFYCSVSIHTEAIQARIVRSVMNTVGCLELRQDMKLTQEVMTMTTEAFTLVFHRCEPSSVAGTHWDPMKRIIYSSGFMKGNAFNLSKPSPG